MLFWIFCVLDVLGFVSFVFWSEILSFKTTMPRKKAAYYKRKESAAKGTKSFVEACEKRKHEETVVDVGETSTGGETSVRPKTSAEKRLSHFSFDEKNVNERHRIIIYEDTIERILEKTMCKDCEWGKLSVKYVRHQLDTYVSVSCDVCDVIYKEETNVKENNIHPVTLLLIWCCLLLGLGFDGVERIISFLNLRHFAHRTYLRYIRYITKCTVEKTEDILEKSREATRKFYGKKTGELVETDVTFDGSWHRRGHRSNYGIGAVIDSDSALILDYSTLSKFCMKCSQKEAHLVKRKITETKYVEWLDEHYSSDVCDMNFDGTSSGAMEAAHAVAMWGRSENFGFKYKTFITDGDSSAFKAVTEMSNGNGPYGKERPVMKAECVNHVAKRLGTALRNLKIGKVDVDSSDDDDGEPPKKKRKTGMGGKHKLDNVIDHLQIYFSVSLKRKVGTDASTMRNEILSTFYHCTSTDEEPHHELCAKGPQSWCTFNRKQALGEKIPSHKEMKIYFHLTKRQLAKVKGIYDRLTTDEMMERCMKGMTQNRNESLHSRVWKICPKHKNVSKLFVDFASATAVMHYNVGYEMSNLCDIFGMESPSGLVRYLKKKDINMCAPIKVKMRRRKLRKDIEHYAAGAF